MLYYLVSFTRPITIRERLPMQFLLITGSLQSITDKLKLLSDMMHTPPGSTEAENQPKYTPLERLKLLREVTEDARTFQVGGEDKIRVATNTCESVSE